MEIGLPISGKMRMYRRRSSLRGLIAIACYSQIDMHAKNGVCFDEEAEADRR